MSTAVAEYTKAEEAYASAIHKYFPVHTLQPGQDIPRPIYDITPEVLEEIETLKRERDAKHDAWLRELSTRQ